MPEPATHRLVDMVVEEVSLVDRAANRHRFLIVKRDPMAEESNEQPATDDIAEVGDTDFGGDTTGVPDGLVQTLEALTTAVETLDAGGKVDAAALAASLAAAAEALAPAAAHTAPAAVPASAASVPATTAAPPGALDARSAIVALAAALGVDLGTSAPASSAPAVPAAAVPPPTTPIAPSLDASALRASLDALTTAVREQGQRLARVEKQFGLPNSAAVEGGTPAKPRAVSWPADLNRPLDRDSVEKTVSFHDL